MRINDCPDMTSAVFFECKARDNENEISLRLFRGKGKYRTDFSSRTSVNQYYEKLLLVFTGVKLGHMKNALVSFYTMYTTPRVHSSYYEVFPRGIMSV